eukprot:GHVS01098311.1.p1 GENE.GHVS01098311.1~~GHVS01098311.1.p1  ORF type:complete len:448 (+),score=55.21 GHVS01098311.1:333-1676(+)
MNRSVNNLFRLPTTTTSPLFCLPSIRKYCYISSSSHTKQNSTIPTSPPARCQSLPIASSFADLVGNTPIVQLKVPSQLTGCRILAKCEFLNPGGSVKDRPAVRLIKQAETQGQLIPSPPSIGSSYFSSSHTSCSSSAPLSSLSGCRLIVEGTAGNTGIGLALVGNVSGYTTVCVLPDTQTQEKKDALLACGCLLVEVAGQKIWHPNHFVSFSGRLAKTLNGFWAQQFDNINNRASHYDTTGPEIWQQTAGRLDGFVSCVGTGGTLAGAGSYLKERNVSVALADVPGAVLHRYYSTGELKAVGSSIVENIGQGRVTGNLEGFRPDLSFEIPDEESVHWCHSLLKDEGLAVGMTSGVNVAGAVRLAKEMGPGHTIVTLLCDYGQRYAKKQYNPDYLKTQNLPYPRWLVNDCPKNNDFLASAVSESTASTDEVDEAVSRFGANSVPGAKV